MLIQPYRLNNIDLISCFQVITQYGEQIQRIRSEQFEQDLMTQKILVKPTFNEDDPSI